MIAVYAMGGGLGHLARARRVLRALGQGDASAAILTASPLAQGPDIVRVPRRLAHSRVEFAAWLKKTLRSLAPSKVVVDAFPLGILGELADPSVLPDVPLYHVARILKWDAYRDAFAGAPKSYEKTLAVEALTPRHEEFLGSNSGVLQSMDLPFDAPEEKRNPFANMPGPVWLVVHSGCAAEVNELLAFSFKKSRIENVSPHYVVVSPRTLDLPTGVERITHSRPWELYPHAARIVTACGFNSMLEAAPWRSKHLFLPLERRFDDQYLRAARARC